MRVRIGFVALVVLVGLAVIVGPSITGASVPAPPSRFVSIIQDQGNGFRWQMSLYSSQTGKLSRSLASFSQSSFTNNGLALAPSGNAVYFTLIPRHAGRRFGLRLMRFDVETRRQTLIADGAQPAISDDGTQLAYATFPHGLAVRELASGQTRKIGLAAQLGRQADPLKAAVVWLGDGTDVAIIPSPPAWDLVRRQPSPAHWCGTTSSHAVIVLVHVPTPPAPLTADCVRLAGPAMIGAIALAASPTSPTSVLVATDGPGDSTRVEQIADTGKTEHLLTIRSSLPVAFDPSGTHLMYLIGHSPPTLWQATITDGHLTNRLRLPKHNWGAIAW